jgi:hypothetical protein
MQQVTMPGILKPHDAPPGYVAVLKSDVATPHLGNICRACDWRPDCSGDTYRCMPYELANGKKRHDECSVVFKKLTPNTEAQRAAVGGPTGAQS